MFSDVKLHSLRLIIGNDLVSLLLWHCRTTNSSTYVVRNQLFSWYLLGFVLNLRTSLEFTGVNIQVLFVLTTGAEYIGFSN